MGNKLPVVHRHLTNDRWVYVPCDQKYEHKP